MSFSAVAKAVEAPLSGNLKLVFILMANYADEKDRCYPSQATLARQAGVSEKTIQRAIEKLEEIGFVSVLRKGTGNKSSVYCLNFEVEGSQNVTPDNLSGSQNVHSGWSNCPGRVDNLSGEGGQNVHRSYQDTINDPINDPINNMGDAKKDKTSKFNPELITLPDYVNRDIWIDYCKMRKAKRSEIKTPKTVELCLKDLAKYSGGDTQKATEILEQAIRNTWTGIYPINYQPQLNKTNKKPNAHHNFNDRKYEEYIPDIYK